MPFGYDLAITFHMKREAGLPENVPLPAIKKARAIITDEGGVMSHPSIIARELRIPAIVGTKFATSKLKNGMQVRMDFLTGAISVQTRKTAA